MFFVKCEMLKMIRLNFVFFEKLFHMKPDKKLYSWTKSFEFVKDIYIVTSKFPVEEKFGLTSQMRRASVSIPVNIAEGAARKSPKEFRQFLYISLGSLSELDTLILLSESLSINKKDKSDLLIEKLDVIGKLIYGLAQKIVIND